jgi:hypothetical protein
VPAAATLFEPPVPLRADPARSAVLPDGGRTGAPIELEERADLLVDGPPGVRTLVAAPAT